MKIEISEKTCIHLGKYASDKGLLSFSTAIESLLAISKGSAPLSKDISRRYKAYVRKNTDDKGTPNVYANALDSLRKQGHADVWAMSISEAEQLHLRFRKGGDLQNLKVSLPHAGPAVGKFIKFLKEQEKKQ